MEEAPAANSTLKYSRRNLAEIIATPYIDDYVPPHQLGPDYVLPTESEWTSSITGSVKLLLTGKETGDEKPVSIITFMKTNMENYADNVAMSVERNGHWINWSYADYWSEINTIAKAYIKLGLGRFNAVAHLGFNAPEWCISYLATILAGGVPTGIYLTNSPSACEYILKHCKAVIVIVENEMQLDKILQVKENLPHLKTIVQYTGTPSHEDVLSWEDLKLIGRSVNDDVIDKRVRSIAVNQCCSLIYTSGTTGEPKAAMLSHDNITQLIYGVRKNPMGQRVFFDSGRKTILSYLPLNHLAAQGVDIYMTIGIGGRLYFARPDALKGSLVTTLQEVQPTIFMSLPRFYEKIKERFEERMTSKNFLTKAAIEWALRCGYRNSQNRIKRVSSKDFGYFLARPILKQIRKQIGLSDTLACSIGGAPFGQDTFEFFCKLGIILEEAYGLSESSGPVIYNVLEAFKYSSCGKVEKEDEFQIDNPDSNGEGEILLRSRQNYMGYLNAEEDTKKTIDSERWLHSGDIGRMDNDGYVFITGRIKEIVITAGGENIAPYPIEEAVKSELPIISQAMVVGDKKKYLSMLLTLKTNLDSETLTPLDTLSDVSVDWCRENGSDAQTVQDILEGPDAKVMAAIAKGIQRANMRAISNACKIQKWKILPQNFTFQAEEIGPTLKLKRFFIMKKYQSVIEEIYK